MILYKWSDLRVLCVFGQAIERDKKQRELREQAPCVANPIGTNDFDYEDEQKLQDSVTVYEGLHFDLAAENSKTSLFSYRQSFCCDVCDHRCTVSLMGRVSSVLLRVVRAFGASAE